MGAGPTPPKAKKALEAGAKALKEGKYASRKEAVEAAEEQIFALLRSGPEEARPKGPVKDKKPSGE